MNTPHVKWRDVLNSPLTAVALEEMIFSFNGQKKVTATASHTSILCLIETQSALENVQIFISDEWRSAHFDVFREWNFSPRWNTLSQDSKSWEAKIPPLEHSVEILSPVLVIWLTFSEPFIDVKGNSSVSPFGRLAPWLPLSLEALFAFIPRRPVRRLHLCVLWCFRGRHTTRGLYLSFLSLRNS